MKQMIYRRASGASTGTGGYAVTARAESITAMQSSKAQKHARIPALTDGNIKNRISFYRQYQLDADTLAVSCGFYDPHDPRGSVIVLTAMTENRDERARYLARMPAATGYFDAVKTGYAQSGELEIEKGDMMIRPEDYLAQATCSRADALTVIREELGSEDAVQAMFSALLDVSSSNPRMIVAFMDAQDLVQVGERGRRLAEALLSCLPDSAACAVGYMSPALDDSENTAFGLRFALKGGNFKFSGAQTQAYTFELPAGNIAKPKNADGGAEEYARELARLVMQGDAAALKRIDELRATMEDASCFRSKDKSKNRAGGESSVPAEMAIRYALVARPERLEAAEMRRLLDWRHAMIDEALAKDSAGFEPFAFWTRVNEWTLKVCLPELWANQSSWKKGGGAYAPEAVLRVFEDSQRLHAAGRAEAIGYREFVEKKLTDGTLYADGQILLDRLIKYFKTCAETAVRTPGALESRLYFAPVENWLRTVWLNMRPAPRSRDILAPVEQLYAAGALEQDQLQAYVDGYSELIFDGRDGLFAPNESKFHAAVVQAVMKNNPGRLAESMRADLKGKNPYASAGAVPVWQWYRALATKLSELEGEFLSGNRENLEKALARTGVDSIPALMNDLSTNQGMIAVAGKMDASLNAREMIERRVAALSKSSGVGMYYPERIELAAGVSAILEKYDGGRWMQEHRALTDVCNMNPGRLTLADFDRFAQIQESGMRPGAVDRARELLEQAMRRAWSDPADAPMESVLTGVCMLALGVNGGGVCFNPERAANKLEKLGVREQKLAAFCKKNADEDASEGVGYLADVMLSYLKTPAKKRTGESVAYPKAWTGQKKRRAPLAEMPVAVPVVGIVVFAGGLAASTIGLLNYIGLL